MQSIRNFLDGSNPLKVSTKKNMEIELGKIGDVGGTSSKSGGHFEGEWGRHGSPWADTLGK